MKELKAKTQSSNTYDPWAALRAAIIRQAASDYRQYGKKLRRCSDPEERRYLSNEMKEISRFFLSEWCDFLSDQYSGSEILEALDLEVFGIDECS